MKSSIKFKLISTTVLISILLSVQIAFLATSALSKTILIAFSILIVLLNLILGFIMALTISKGVKETSDSLKNLATKQRDLTFQLKPQGSIEINDLAGWFNQFIDKTREILINVTDLVVKNDSLAKQLSYSSKTSAAAVSSITKSILEMKQGSLELDESIFHASASIE